MSGIYFDASEIGGSIKNFGDNGVMVNGKTFFIPSGYGKLTSSSWVGDSLVLTDQSGNRHFFVAQGRSFVAFKGEKGPHDFINYNKALKESREARACAEGTKVKKAKKKEKNCDDTKEKKSWISRIFKGFWWMIKGIVKILFNVLLFIGVLGNQKE